MNNEKFSLMQYSISSILGLIDAEEFVIPEIQRPFVWNRTQVRDLIDSLYNGYPTGYIITWKNPDVQTKEGKKSNGKKILIDGQQRITAIMASIVGKSVLDDDFNQDRIKIAFNPFPDEECNRFAVQDASHLKDKRWVPDISALFKSDFDAFAFATEYCESNPGIKPNAINNEVTKLKGIANRQIGVIELDQHLDIDVVTDIFIRINSKGTVLSQADFVMSKMAADGDFECGHGGSVMRKTIDYFSHLSAKPEFFPLMKNDSDFTKSKYFAEIKWLAKNKDDIYNPNYDDVLRVAFMSKFGRAKLSDMMSLLSGRDFETRRFLDSVVQDSYKKLDAGILNFVNKYNFTNFISTIQSAGFVSKSILRSQMTLNFAYTLYLLLQNDPNVAKNQVKRYVQKWFVLSTLTSRYTGSPETKMDQDIRGIAEKGFAKFLSENEASLLSETFWNITLPQDFETSSVSSPALNVFFAAQIRLKCNSFLQNGTWVSTLLECGDVHHIFPKAYLKKNGIDSKIKYNQVANYIYLDSPVNKAVGEKAPCEYLQHVLNQKSKDRDAIGNIFSKKALMTNMSENAIPSSLIKMTAADYETFLQERRQLMAALIKKYYMDL